MRSRLTDEQADRMLSDPAVLAAANALVADPAAAREKYGRVAFDNAWLLVRRAAKLGNQDAAAQKAEL